MKQLNVLVLSKAAEILIHNIEKALEPRKNFSFFTEGESSSFDIVLIQYNYYQDNKDKLDLEGLKNKKTAVLANFTDNSLLDEILNELTPYHLIGLSDFNAISDIRDFLLSFSIKKIWTPEILIQSPYKTHTLQVVNSLDYQSKIQEMFSILDFSNCFDGFSAYLTQVTNELLTNALYNAPVNQEGLFIYKNKSRSEKISMLPGKEIEFKVLENDQKIVLSVKDLYGSLIKESIDFHLNNNMVMKKEGGAGVGLYTAFRYANKLIFNVRKQESTEVIIILNKLKRNKQYSLIDKSFHFFEY